MREPNEADDPAVARVRAADAAPLRSVAALPGPRKDMLLLAAMQLLEALVQSGHVQVQRMCWTCKHYRGDRDTLHHCALLKKDLVVQELRTDCSEHEQAA